MGFIASATAHHSVVVHHPNGAVGTIVLALIGFGLTVAPIKHPVARTVIAGTCYLAAIALAIWTFVPSELVPWVGLVAVLIAAVVVFLARDRLPLGHARLVVTFGHGVGVFSLGLLFPQSDMREPVFRFEQVAFANRLPSPVSFSVVLRIHPANGAAPVVLRTDALQGVLDTYEYAHPGGSPHPAVKNAWNGPLNIDPGKTVEIDLLFLWLFYDENKHGAWDPVPETELVLIDRGTQKEYAVPYDARVKAIKWA